MVPIYLILPFHLFFYPASDPLERASSTRFTLSLPIAEISEILTQTEMVEGSGSTGSGSQEEWQLALECCEILTFELEAAILGLN